MHGLFKLHPTETCLTSHSLHWLESDDFSIGMSSSSIFYIFFSYKHELPFRKEQTKPFTSIKEEPRKNAVTMYNWIGRHLHPMTTKSISNQE